MARCPHCGKELTHLRNIQECLVAWNFDASGEYENTGEMISTGGVNEWVCPHCGKTIAYSEEKALAFLNQKNNN